ncbi:Protein of unknown function [Salinihabitans flavidus]|uniref:Adenylate cyclase n=1 Tax=Salinihabitans flavidus TaxID=569882 RepID=A0A1H8LJ16_9RHOB|nr:DUF3095 domain-containing protein [Salinihabitans flavidus]SEO04748.1 Protein of unknown function [Salinihabitans flavidus]
MRDTAEFYDTIPKASDFDALAGDGSYRPMPDDWVLGVADIVGSTQHIVEGRYKIVNMIGAAVIASQVNAADGRALPYMFGGDGAGFAVWPDQADTARRELAAVQAWAKREFDIDLRAAMIPVSHIRNAGHDLRVARYKPSQNIDYAMFSGGGLSWAEAELKAGTIALDPALQDAVPNLDGLSCRWNHIRARHGTILSLVTEPAPGALPEDVATAIHKIVAIADSLDRGGHPMPPDGPGVSWPPPGLGIEAHAAHGTTPLWRTRLSLLIHSLMAWFFLRSGVKAGDFDPAHYRNMVVQNADFRKFDDGLKMTLDCDPDTQKRIEQVLQDAEKKGILRYGLFTQDEAMMTCFVPSMADDSHVHFVDGAAGGYAQATLKIKGGESYLRR